MIKECLKMFVCLLFCVFLLNVSMYRAMAVEDWNLIIDKNDVQVYERSTSDTSIKEFKGITVVNARMEVIGEVLRNVKDHPKWMDRCKETQIIKTYDDGSVIAHVIIDVPWPASTRDVIVKQSLDVSLDEKKGTITIAILFNAIDFPDIPPTKGVIRIKDFTGKYVLEYVDRDHTKITYQTKTDPIGALPSMVANLGSRTVPYNTLHNLHKEVKKPFYSKVLTDPANINKENLFIAKLILKTEMKKYVDDQKLIDSLINDDLVKQILTGKELTAKEAAKIILAKQLRMRVEDEAVIEDIVNDNTLVVKLLRNKSLNEKDAVKLVFESRLRKYTKDAAVIETILSNDELITQLLNGEKITEKELRHMIEVR